MGEMVDDAWNRSPPIRLQNSSLDLQVQVYEHHSVTHTKGTSYESVIFRLGVDVFQGRLHETSRRPRSSGTEMRRVTPILCFIAYSVLQVLIQVSLFGRTPQSWVHPVPTSGKIEFLRPGGVQKPRQVPMI